MTGQFISRIRFSLLFFVAVILSLSLISCKKKNPVVDEINSDTAKTTEPSDEELYNFYSPAEDDASWVESLLMQIEEERIAEELSKMESSLENYQVEENQSGSEAAVSDNTEPQEELNPVEKFFEEAKEGKVITGKNNELRFYEFDKEILAPQFTADGLVVVHSNDSSVTRNFYDLKYQLVKKEEWTIKSASDAKKLKTEEFVYSEENGKVIKKDIVTEKTRESVLYNAEGLPSASKKYAVEDDKNYILMERTWAYNEQNKVIKDVQNEYLYKSNDYSDKPELFSRRYEYTFNDTVNQNEEGETEENEIPPDSKYYENNVLKMKKIYTAQKGAYYTWVYFDENLAVKTYYEDDIRVRDEFYNNGKLFRTKTYEKPQTQEEQTDGQTVVQGEKR